jgi:hypothetical protein
MSLRKVICRRWSHMANRPDPLNTIRMTWERAIIGPLLYGNAGNGNLLVLFLEILFLLLEFLFANFTFGITLLQKIQRRAENVTIGGL